MIYYPPSAAGSAGAAASGYCRTCSNVTGPWRTGGSSQGRLNLINCGTISPAVRASKQDPPGFYFSRLPDAE